MICVFPIVYVDLRFAESPAWLHYGWVAGVLIAATAIEFYFFFYISRKAVHQVSELIHLHDLTSHLKHGRLNAALALCQLDFIKG